MKKQILLFPSLLLFICIGLYGNWKYKPLKKSLLYMGSPFPVYKDIVTPIGSFSFIPFGKNVFEKYGWFPIKIAIKTKVGKSISNNLLKRGWFFSNTRPSNLPKEWIYFPESKLFAKPEAFFRLLRFWERIYENIPVISSQIYNPIHPEKFYRIQTEYLKKDLIKIEVKKPKNWILVFEKNLKNHGFRKNYIFYVQFPKIKMRKTAQLIKLVYYYPNGKKQYKSYWIIYQKDTTFNLKRL